jgi:hypothetical protein
MRLLRLLRRGRRKAQPVDSEQLLRIYRETHRQIEELRRAA